MRFIYTPKEMKVIKNKFADGFSFASLIQKDRRAFPQGMEAFLT